MKSPALINSIEYEQIFGAKLFALAESGSLREFCEVVLENDVRLFSKLKRYETISSSLSKNFTGISRFGYFTPLLVAI